MRSPVTTLMLSLCIAGSPAIANAQATIRYREAQAVPVTKTLEVAPPPPPGPPPQNLNFESSATYGIFAKVVWSAAPNAASYVVTRGKMDDPTCCNANSGQLPANATSWVDAGLFRKGQYTYTVTVNYADGSVGKNAVSLVVLKDAAPSAITVADSGPGRLWISWDPGSVPGTCCVMIKGPGLGPTNQKMVIGGGPVSLTLLQPGMYSWTIVGAYDQAHLPIQPGANYGSQTNTYTVYGTTQTTQSTYVVLAPPSEWATVSKEVTYVHGRYRISLAGFKAIATTAEDPFRNDGRGDEVFLTAEVAEIGRNGSLVSSRFLETPTFGDVQSYPGRVQAGSAGNTGGIMPGDRYPAEAQEFSSPASTNNLPYLLWEGELGEIDNAVIISPALWETDGGEELVPSFTNFQNASIVNVPYRQAFSAYLPNTYGSGRGLLDTWNPQHSCPAKLSPDSPPTLFVPPISYWLAEPVDMDHNNPYCPTYVVINARVADTWTRGTTATVLEIPFKNLNWEYRLYLRIERLTQPGQAIPVAAPVRAVRSLRQ